MDSSYLMRFFAPVFLLATAGWVGWVNTGTERRIVFPFLDRIAQDPSTQGQLTVALLLSISGVAFVLALRQRPPPE